MISGADALGDPPRPQGGDAAGRRAVMLGGALGVDRRAAIAAVPVEPGVPAAEATVGDPLHGGIVPLALHDVNSFKGILPKTTATPPSDR